MEMGKDVAGWLKIIFSGPFERWLFKWKTRQKNSKLFLILFSNVKNLNNEKKKGFEFWKDGISCSQMNRCVSHHF